MAIRIVCSFGLVTSLCAFAACTAERAVPSWDFSIEADKDFERTPIVLIHGRGMKPQSWDGFINHLVDNGYPRAYLQAIRLEPSDGRNIPAATQQIAPYVDTYLEQLNAWLAASGASSRQHEKVDLIAHSMGSLSSRWYVSRIAPEKVRTWISLAGPNHGSSPGCPGPWRSGKRDSCPAYATSAEENPLQFSLNGGPGPDIDETPYGTGIDAAGVERVPPNARARVSYFTFRLPDDQWIEPKTSPIIDGAGGTGADLSDIPLINETSPGNYLVETGVDHDYIMQDQSVRQAILRILADQSTDAEAF